jgi:filamentous hemagglutinin
VAAEVAPAAEKTAAMTASAEATPTVADAAATGEVAPGIAPMPGNAEFIGPVRPVTTWQGYQAQVGNLYGGTAEFSSRAYQANVGGVLRNGIADNVASVGGLDVAVEAKFGGEWASSIRNPRSPVALGRSSRGFARRERHTVVDQARRYNEAFDEVHYHTTMPELAQYYSKLLKKLGLDDIKFFHTPPGVY